MVVKIGVARVFNHHTAPVNSLDFTKDGERLIGQPGLDVPRLLVRRAVGGVVAQPPPSRQKLRVGSLCTAVREWEGGI